MQDRQNGFAYDEDEGTAERRELREQRRAQTAEPDPADGETADDARGIYTGCGMGRTGGMYGFGEYDAGMDGDGSAPAAPTQRAAQANAPRAAKNDYSTVAREGLRMIRQGENWAKGAPADFRRDDARAAAKRLRRAMADMGDGLDDVLYAIKASGHDILRNDGHASLRRALRYIRSGICDMREALADILRGDMSEAARAINDGIKDIEEGLDALNKALKG